MHHNIRLLILVPLDIPFDHLPNPQFHIVFTIPSPCKMLLTLLALKRQLSRQPPRRINLWQLQIREIPHPRILPKTPNQFQIFFTLILS
jgi:hypothetical protein